MAEQRRAPRPAVRPGRRGLLGGLVVLAGAAACAPFVRAKPRPRTTGPEAPDVVTARRVLAAEDALLAAYAAAVRRHPSLARPLKPFRRRHEAHRLALSGHLPAGYTPSGSPTPSGTASGVATASPTGSPTGASPPPASPTASGAPKNVAAELTALRAAERAAATARLDDAMAAGPALAELLASVGACEAVHAKLLRGVET